jgi:hypothetical protein
MAVFYFDIYNDDVTLDEEGVELADEQAAHARAIKEARILAADTVQRGHLVRHHRIDIRDENHTTIGSVSFEEAVDIQP